MNFIRLYRYMFYCGILALAGCLISWWIGTVVITQIMLILGLVLIAIGFQGIEVLKGFSYAVCILAAVVISMSYPQHFVSLGSFQLKGLIIPLLQIIMFGMGSQMGLKDFSAIIKTPKAVFIGVICQFSIMPLVALALVKVFEFPVEIAAGIILVGASPSGLASNVMSFLAKANVALSITLTALATLLAPVMTPLLMKLLAGQLIPVNFWKMMLGIMDIVILPIIAGLLFNAVVYGKTSKNIFIKQTLAYLFVIAGKNIILLLHGKMVFTDTLLKFLVDVFWFIGLPVLMSYLFSRFISFKQESMDKTLSMLSMVGIGLIITIITANGRESLLDIGALLIVACLLQNVLGYSLGYWLCRLLGLDQASCRTIALEVGMQNSGLASGIALQMGKVATLGLAPSVFGPLMNMTGSSLSSWWRFGK